MVLKSPYKKSYKLWSLTFLLAIAGTIAAIIGTSQSNLQLFSNGLYVNEVAQFLGLLIFLYLLFNGRKVLNYAIVGFIVTVIIPAIVVIIANRNQVF